MPRTLLSEVRREWSMGPRGRETDTLLPQDPHAPRTTPYTVPSLKGRAASTGTQSLKMVTKQKVGKLLAA